MVTMHMLRMLADLSFYYTFAGFAAAMFGGEGAMLALLVQCVCFGLSSLGGKRRWLRLALLIPVALCWFVYPASADRIAMIPAVLYLVIQAVRGDYELSWDRQVRLFSVFWKVLILIAAVCCVLGHAAVVTAAMLPFGMIMLLSSVVLMRSLRHDARVYCQRSYQVLNVVTVAVTAALAFLMSTEVFLRGCVTALKTVYTYCILPIFMLLLEGLMYVSQALSYLAQLFGFAGWEVREPQEQDVELGAQEMDLGHIETVNIDWLKWVLIAVIACAAIVVLVLFFRWLSKREQTGSFELSPEVERERYTPQAKQKKQRDESPVRGVRAQYKKFLKLCVGRGVHLAPGTTTSDVDEQARAIPGVGETSGRIRAIYLRARYAGSAEKQDVEQMKQLCAQAKKDAEARMK